MKLNFGWSPSDGDAHPQSLRPSRIPLVLVCGAPCSGKTKFVESKAGAHDLIIDLDTIASGLAGTTRHAWRRSDWLTLALKARNALLMQLGEEASVYQRAWLIVGAPNRLEREWWRDRLHPERIVVLETGQDTCLDRLFADPERRLNRAVSTVGIHGWWQRYSRRANDEVVRISATVG